MLSALIDLGADKQKVIDSIYTCENILSGSKIKDVRFEKVDSKGFTATRFYFEYREEIQERKGIEILNDISKSLEYLDLKPRFKSFIVDSIKTLIDAEAKIHGEPVNQVYLHEASSIDTFADLIGCRCRLPCPGRSTVWGYACHPAVSRIRTGRLSPFHPARTGSASGRGNWHSGIP